jgi:ubiquinone/menaquinone biosynthesis C-methylase UbiE
MVTATLGQLHERVVFNRRVSVLGEALGALVDPGSTILDVGTGDGQIARLIAAEAPDTSVRGIDIMARPTSHIPVDIFDGQTIPHPDNSFDVVSFVDVLHHTDDPRILLKEAARVARKAVILKDHFSQNGVDHLTLRFMDWVGNAPHGVVLPYNYASRETWQGWYDEAGLDIDSVSTDVPLYPAPFNLVFGRGLHFVARLTPRA